MSDKERAMQLLDSVPAYKMGYVIAYLQGITADDEADDAFCESLIAEYEASEEKGDCVSIEELAEECGVDLNEV